MPDLAILAIFAVGVLVGFEGVVLVACGLPSRSRLGSYRRHVFWTHADYYAPWLADRAYERAASPTPLVSQGVQQREEGRSDARH